MVPELIEFLPILVGGTIAVSLAGIAGWIYTTRLKISNGYPLEGMWGQSLKPAVTNEAMERIKLLSQENAALRAELGSIKDRVGNVERIVTDSGYQLTHQIDALRDNRRTVEAS